MRRKHMEGGRIDRLCRKIVFVMLVSLFQMIPSLMEKFFDNIDKFFVH